MGLLFLNKKGEWVEDKEAEEGTWRLIIGNAIKNADYEKEKEQSNEDR
jgi:hypothetical protein